MTDMSITTQTTERGVECMHGDSLVAIIHYKDGFWDVAPEDNSYAVWARSICSLRAAEYYVLALAIHAAEIEKLVAGA